MKLGTVSVMADGTNGNKSGRKRDGENWSKPEKRQAKPEFALELDHPRAYTLFLQKSTEEFLEDYQERYPVFRDWLQGRNVNRFYIGNAFCHLLFPETEQIFALLEKAEKELLQVTFTFSYVREYQLVQTEKLLEKTESVVSEREQKTGN